MQAHVNNYPESAHMESAMEIISRCYDKLEQKEKLAADLYFRIGAFRASAIAFTQLLNHYPQSPNADQYKLMIIRSYYEYASKSILSKQQERFEKAVAEYYDFTDRFPDSKLMPEAQKYFQLSQNNLKAIKNEQTNQKS